MPPFFTRMPRTRSPRDPGDDRDRRGEQQGTRRGDDEHGERAAGASGRGPRDPGDDEGERDEGQRIAVREACERRLGAARLGDEADDAGVGALRGGRERDEIERGAGVDRAARRAIAGRALDRTGLAGERRLVEDRRAALDAAIHRQDLARLDDETVPRAELLDRHDDEAAVRVPMRRLRGPLDECGELAFRAPGRVVFERPAGRDHEPDDRAREIFAQSEGAGEGEQGDEVDAEFPAPQALRHRPQEPGQRDRRDRAPQPGRPLWSMRHLSREPRPDRRDGDEDRDSEDAEAAHGHSPADRGGRRRSRVGGARRGGAPRAQCSALRGRRANAVSTPRSVGRFRSACLPGPPRA